ncbi:MAG: nucleoside recognition domain-containing protein [bacterium]|nr:nucleoside recognition domain-containing protein [bacterium]
MVNIIWALFIIIGIIYSLISGNFNVINNEILISGKSALDLLLGMLPLLVIWMGLMKVAEEAGIISAISKMMSPILKKIFPSVPDNDPSLGFIASNIAANMAGLGSAATPFGLKAMESLQKLNKDKKVASEAMITFLVLNTSGVTIVPTTIISLRLLYGSVNPSVVLPFCIIATTCSTIGGLTIDYLIRRKNGNR